MLLITYSVAHNCVSKRLLCQLLWAYILKHYPCLKVREVNYPRISLPTLCAYLGNLFYGLYLVAISQSKYGDP